MIEYAKKPENQLRTLDSNPRASKQAPISEVFQAYRDGTLEKSVQPTMQLQGVNINEALEKEASQLSLLHKKSSMIFSPIHKKVIQMVPNLADVAIARLCKLMGVDKETSHDQINDALRRVLRNNTILSLGLPTSLTQNIIQAHNANANADFYRIIFEFYNVNNTTTATPNLQNNLGGDVGRIDATDYTNQYTELITALNQYLMGPGGLIQKAINAGITQEANMNSMQALENGAFSARDTIDSRMGIYWNGNKARDKRRGMIAGGFSQFSTLVNPTIPNPGNSSVPTSDKLPDVSIDDRGIGAITRMDGSMAFGLATGKSQVMHEAGHHLEQNLGVNDLVMIHNFLRARTRNDRQNGDRPAGWGVLGKDVSGAYGTGYDAELPNLGFGHVAGILQPSNHSLVKFLGANIIAFLIGGQQKVDQFFFQESNSESTSYATLIVDTDYNTEFISTTAELLSTIDSANKLINNDPLRVALFLYITNRPIYDSVNVLLQNNTQQTQDLDDLIHVIY